MQRVPVEAVVALDDPHDRRTGADLFDETTGMVPEYARVCMPTDDCVSAGARNKLEA